MSNAPSARSRRGFAAAERHETKKQAGERPASDIQLICFALVPIYPDPITIGAALWIVDLDHGAISVPTSGTPNYPHSAAAVELLYSNICIAARSPAVELIPAIALILALDSTDRRTSAAKNDLNTIVNCAAPLKTSGLSIRVLCSNKITHCHQSKYECHSSSDLHIFLLLFAETAPG
jgi:hypothetical protein